jgi:hypothetical protein
MIVSYDVNFDRKRDILTLRYMEEDPDLSADAAMRRARLHLLRVAADRAQGRGEAAGGVGAHVCRVVRGWLDRKRGVA